MEREYKISSIIKIENKNLLRVTKEIKNSPDLSDQQKNILFGFFSVCKSY